MFSLFAPCLGIDLGTANTLVYMKGKGIILREPSVVAMKNNRKDIIAVGEEAKKMIGRTPGNIIAVRPLKDGVIADFNTTEIMLKYFIRKSIPQGLFFRRSPRLVICIPCGITEVEKRAVEEAAKSAGAREVLLLEEPMAAAIGAGLDVYQAKGCMVVDVGGGTSEVAIISLGGIVTSRSLRVGGNHMDEAIMKHIKKTHGMIIGESTAEHIKITIGCVVDRGKDQSMEVRGRDITTGLPISVTIGSSNIKDALLEPIQNIIDTIKNVLEHTPPELAADIINEGIVMTGGASMLHGLNRLVAKATGMPVRRAENPLDTVAIGAGLALEELESKIYGQELTTEPSQ
ncbi:MAG: rod shape-determining protein [Eubacteriales bacterium]|nr:rod shape-determining protein [Eubacteriales bacterium]